MVQRNISTRVSRPATQPFSLNFEKFGVPAVGGLKFSMTQKKNSKKCQLEEVPVGGSASWGTRASWGTKFNPWTDDFFPVL